MLCIADGFTEFAQQRTLSTHGIRRCATSSFLNPRKNVVYHDLINNIDRMIGEVMETTQTESDKLPTRCLCVLQYLKRTDHRYRILVSPCWLCFLCLGSFVKHLSGYRLELFTNCCTYHFLHGKAFGMKCEAANSGHTGGCMVL